MNGTPDEAAQVAAIRAHAEKHRKSGRATFSVAGIEALLGMLDRAIDLADKYKWQVRNTCTRAEKAEIEIGTLHATLFLVRSQIDAVSQAANVNVDHVFEAIDRALRIPG